MGARAISFLLWMFMILQNFLKYVPFLKSLIPSVLRGGKIKNKEVQVQFDVTRNEANGDGVRSL